MNYQKIDPEFKARWITALRSDNYIQGESCLREDADDRSLYCCLGVGCDVIDPTLWHKYEVYTDQYDWGDTRTNEDATFPFLKDIDATQALIELNDSLGANFDAIADWIEVNL